MQFEESTVDMFFSLSEQDLNFSASLEDPSLSNPSCDIESSFLGDNEEVISCNLESSFQIVGEKESKFNSGKMQEFSSFKVESDLSEAFGVELLSLLRDDPDQIGSRFERYAPSPKLENQTASCPLQKIQPSSPVEVLCLPKQSKPTLNPELLEQPDEQESLQVREDIFKPKSELRQYKNSLRPDVLFRKMLRAFKLYWQEAIKHELENQYGRLLRFWEKRIKNSEIEKAVLNVITEKLSESSILVSSKDKKEIQGLVESFVLNHSKVSSDIAQKFEICGKKFNTTRLLSLLEDKIFFRLL